MIAKNDFNYFVRCEAEGKLEKLLFNIRLDEIKNSSNQKKLKEMVQIILEPEQYFQLQPKMMLQK